AEPRVEDQLVPAYPPGAQVGHAFAQRVADVTDHVVVHRTVLHRVGVSTPVHHHERHPGGGHDPCHVGVGQTSADVVHDGGTRLNGLPCDRSPHGVDRD